MPVKWAEVLGIQFGVVSFRCEANGALGTGETFAMPDIHTARRFAEALMLVPVVVGAVVTGRASRVAAGSFERGSGASTGAGYGREKCRSHRGYQTGLLAPLGPEWVLTCWPGQE